MNDRKRFKKRTIAAVAAALLALAFLGAVCYVEDYYHADVTALDAMKGNDSVTVKSNSYGYLFDGSGENDLLIFYPGAKVEEEAYAPLLLGIAEQGVDAYLVRMPCRLAFFGMERAADVMQISEYKNYYIGGHSLGGAMAAVFAADHGEHIDGLVMCAAYPTKQLPEDMKVLTVYGSEDKILSMGSLEQGRQYLPRDSRELVIEGGSHAQFGSYGEQAGDGKAEITAEEFRKEAIQAVIDIIK